MEAYDHYSSEGTPWGLSFPNHWQRSKLGRITSKIGSGATPKGGKTVYLDSGKVALIRSLNVHDEGFRYEDLAFIDDEAAAQLNSVSVLDNDVLLNITGASILRTTLAPRGVLPARVNQHVSILRPTDDVNPGYLHAWLASPQMHRYMYSQSVGSTREAITKAQLQGFPIMLPLKPEQDAIVAFLDAKTAEIDGVVEGLVRQRELLERYKRELIAHTVTKGLDTNAPMKDSGIDWIGKIPNSWHSRSLKSLLTRKSRKGEPSWRVLSVERERGVVDRELEGSPDNNNRLPDDLSGYLVVRNGQFVMNKMKAWQGSYGVSLYDGIVSPAYYTFDLASSVDSEFFNWAIRSKAYIPFFGRDSYGIRTDQWDFKVQALRNIPLFVPPVEEQRQIVDYLVQRLKGIDGLITDLDRQVELLRRYRKQVINDVVTGKVRVSEEA
ncbi:restriction endonuclease subunit S [Trueperella bernardiae]|nr:restriction endonuclease subunit S [Trueperella bernardiae]MCM3907699.1 restriction endonuclease subunit S [Trueperella bernardiae]